MQCVKELLVQCKPKIIRERGRDRIQNLGDDLKISAVVEKPWV